MSRDNSVNFLVIFKWLHVLYPIYYKNYDLNIYSCTFQGRQTQIYADPSVYKQEKRTYLT